MTQEADIPAEFFNPQPPKLDQSALSAALREGREVPGIAFQRRQHCPDIAPMTMSFEKRFWAKVDRRGADECAGL